jgi:regulator of protease activity HflC (stomatin/prohibitin superfamily)
MKERAARTLPGLPTLLVLLAAAALTVWALILALQDQRISGVLIWMPVLVVECVLLGGFFMVFPNQSRVLTLFGAYRGSERSPGLRYANPFYAKKSISLRVRNFETEHLKVNDAQGNPIEIAAVVVWRVIDSFEAVYSVDDYENFVHVQSEAALRNLATRYSYDAEEEGGDARSLRSHTAEVAEHLGEEIRERLAQAGVDVLEARISHLAYAPEIAQAMLQRQQATAIIAARQKIVDGAVGMVEMALAKLEEQRIVELDAERRAAMVSNLLVVLCSDRATTPVINTGSLY